MKGEESPSDLRPNSRAVSDERPPRTDAFCLAGTQTREFWMMAARERFVSTTVADQKALESKPVSAAKESVATGLLTSAQAEIVTHLLDPLALVPGYELLDHLGHGGMGVVYKARQIAFDRIVALKTVLVGAREQETATARFEQEARSLGRLVHPHLVTAYDFSRHGGRLSLAMEYISGLDGERWAAQHGPAPERIVWGIIRQAAAGLACAAAAGLIHRDVKPANLLLTDPPQGFPLEPGLPLVKVADFGLSLLAEWNDEATRLTLENMVVGSPHFMAPEQLSGNRVDHRADIYALGATAYRLLSGKRPWNGLPLIQILSRKLTEDPESITSLRNDLSPATLQLLGEMLERDPGRRLGDYDALLTRIASLVDGLNISSGLAAVATVPCSKVAAEISTAPTERTSEYLQALAIVDTTPEQMRMPKSEGTVTRRTLSRWAIEGGLVALGAAVGVSAWWNLSGRKISPGPRAWRATGQGEPLYDGTTLQGWRVLGGQWIPGRNDGDGGLILAGIDGVIARFTDLGTGRTRRKLTGYQILTIAAVREAHAAEAQFGLRGVAAAGVTDFETGQRGVVRLLADRVVLGTRHSDRGEVERVFAERKLSGGATTFHEIRIERQPDDWYIVIDGELLGTLPADSDRELPEFRLAVESRDGTPPGEAWFGDLVLEELGPVAIQL
jgi:serine/threonine protein kinase